MNFSINIQFNNGIILTLPSNLSQNFDFSIDEPECYKNIELDDYKESVDNVDNNKYNKIPRINPYPLTDIENFNYFCLHPNQHQPSGTFNMSNGVEHSLNIYFVNEHGCIEQKKQHSQDNEHNHHYSHHNHNHDDDDDDDEHNNCFCKKNIFD